MLPFENRGADRRNCYSRCRGDRRSRFLKAEKTKGRVEKNISDAPLSRNHGSFLYLTLCKFLCACFIQGKRERERERFGESSLNKHRFQVP